MQIDVEEPEIKDSAKKSSTYKEKGNMMDFSSRKKSKNNPTLMK